MNQKEIESIVADRMFSSDPFSKWLGIEYIKDDDGRFVLRLTVRKEMLNGFKIAHGGIAYSLADTALAFAANCHGKICVTIETAITYKKQVKEGDILTAVTEEVEITRDKGTFNVTIINQDNEKVALFNGTVFRTLNNWDI